MLAYYELRVFTSYGLPVAGPITDIFSLSIARSRNNAGAFEATLPPDYDETIFGEDYVIEIWRSIDGRNFSLIDDTVWFVRDIEYDLDDNGREVLYVRGHDTTALLNRRVVAWFSFGAAVPGANAPSFKTAPAATAIYEIWEENFGGNVEGTLADSFNTPPPSVTSAVGWTATGTPLSALLRLLPRSPTGPLPTLPVVLEGIIVDGVEIAWMPALDAMRQIADISEQQGEKVWIDIVYTAGETSRLGNFSFKVWTGNRKADISETVVLSPYWDTMKSAKWRRNYTEMANWVHVGGPGQGDLRLVAGITDSNAVVRSAFYPIEAFIDAGEVYDEAGLISLGRAELWRRRARTTISGEIRQSPDLRFGRDYGYGNIVSAFYRNAQVTSTIESYTIDLDNGIENISIPLEGSTDA
jgi:hypothetical protein